MPYHECWMNADRYRILGEDGGCGGRWAGKREERIAIVVSLRKWICEVW